MSNYEVVASLLRRSEAILEDLVEVQAQVLAVSTQLVSVSEQLSTTSAQVVAVAAQLTALSGAIELGQHYESFLFPETSGEFITFTAGGAIDTFGNWAEIVDNNAVTLSSRFTEQGAFSGVLIEDLSVKDKRYVLEVGYGDGTVAGTDVVMRHRFLSGNVKLLDAIQQVVIHSIIVPVGATIYYRMMCEQANATCEISFRYHVHPG